MKTFFNKIWTMTKILFNGSASKHQKWLTYGSLVFGLIISLLLGTILSALLMYIVALFCELVYCFVPTKYVRFAERWFEIPDFKEFKSDKDNYIMNPRHDFKTNNLWFILIGVIMFLILRVLFLIF